MIPANEPIRVHTGGLYRCCVELICEYTRDAIMPLVPGHEVACAFCGAKMELSPERIWQWVRPMGIGS